MCWQRNYKALQGSLNKNDSEKKLNVWRNDMRNIWQNTFLHSRYHPISYTELTSCTTSVYTFLNVFCLTACGRSRETSIKQCCQGWHRHRSMKCKLLLWMELVLETSLPQSRLRQEVSRNSKAIWFDFLEMILQS